MSVSAHRRVYLVQCRTFRRALELTGIKPPEADHGLATRPGDFPAIDTFRARPGHRCFYGQLLRDQVAFSFRMERFRRRHVDG